MKNANKANEVNKILHSEKRLVEVEVNEIGDKIYIPMDDAKFYEKFVDMFNSVIACAESMQTRILEIEKEFERQEGFEAQMARCKQIAAANVEFSNNAVEMVEMVFGKDVLKKYFADIYAKVPDFLPDTDCFMDFIEKITPVIDGVFNKKTERRGIDKSKMAGYRPQKFGK